MKEKKKKKKKEKKKKRKKYIFKHLDLLRGGGAKL
jgi:hypothetical protein